MDVARAGHVLKASRQVSRGVAVVVLLRGANLGKRRFSPKAVEVALADLEIVNIGAAGTFIVRERIAEAALRKRVQAELPWDDAEMVILTEKEVTAALSVGAKVDAPEGAKRFGLALPSAPTAKLKFPLDAIAKDGAWGLRYAAISGRIAIGVRRRYDIAGTYSTKAVDAALGSDRGTMRDWPTWEKIGAVLAGPT